MHDQTNAKQATNKHTIIFNVFQKRKTKEETNKQKNSKKSQSFRYRYIPFTLQISFVLVKKLDTTLEYH